MAIFPNLLNCFSLPHSLECIVLSAEWMHRCIISFLYSETPWMFGTDVLCFVISCCVFAVWSTKMASTVLRSMWVCSVFPHSNAFSTVSVKECNVEDMALILLAFAEPNLSSWCWIFHKAKGQLRSPCANPPRWPFVKSLVGVPCAHITWHNEIAHAQPLPTWLPLKPVDDLYGF